MIICMTIRWVLFVLCFLRITDFRLEYDVKTGVKVKKQYGKRCLRVKQDEVYLRAKKRVENLKAFYIHLTVYILVNVMLFIINIISDSSKLWFLYPLAGWGIGIVIHGLTTFPVGIFGKEWEERKIKEYMEKDK